MAWSRVKNILIAMLVLVNAFLILVYGITTWRENQYAEQLSDDLLRAVSSLGVTLDGELISPEVQTLLPMQVSEDSAADQEIARKLLGVYRETAADGETVFESEKGTLRLGNNGALTLALRLDEPLENERQGKTVIRKILKAFLQDGNDPLFLETEPDQDLCASVQLTLSGMPVFNAVLLFEFYEDAVVVSGKRVLHHPKQLRAGEVQELSGILLSMIGYWEERGLLEQTITGIELGYLTENKKGERQNVIPVWHVAVENGDWYISALDGSIVAPE